MLTFWKRKPPLGSVTVQHFIYNTVFYLVILLLLLLLNESGCVYWYFFGVL